MKVSHELFQLFILSNICKIHVSTALICIICPGADLDFILFLLYNKCVLSNRLMAVTVPNCVRDAQILYKTGNMRIAFLYIMLILSFDSLKSAVFSLFSRF